MEFRRLKIDDIETVNNLNNIGHTNWESEFFSTLKPESCLFACLLEKKAIGCEGYVGYNLVHNGNIVITHRSERTLVDPNYRGKGIFEKLITECDEFAKSHNSLFAWGATGALKPFIRSGYISFVGFRSYVFFPIQKNIKKKIINTVKKIFFYNPLYLFRMVKKREINKIKDFMSFISTIKPINRKNTKDITFGQLDYEKTKKYILDNNKSFYQLFIDEKFISWLNEKGNVLIPLQIYRNEKVVGYVILKQTNNNSYCHILDINIIDVSISDVLQVLSKLKELKNYDSLFLALNSENNIHKIYLQQLKNNWVLNKKIAGSFVIKPLLNTSISIDKLMLTDLWLEL